MPNGSLVVSTAPMFAQLTSPAQIFLSAQAATVSFVPPTTAQAGLRSIQDCQTYMLMLLPSPVRISLLGLKVTVFFVPLTTAQAGAQQVL